MECGISTFYGIEISTIFGIETKTFNPISDWLLEWNILVSACTNTAEENNCMSSKTYQDPRWARISNHFGEDWTVQQFSHLDQREVDFDQE